jgi:hypothetical protein
MSCAMLWGFIGAKLLDHNNNTSNHINRESSPIIWWTACLFTALMQAMGLLIFSLPATDIILNSFILN